MLPHSLRFTRLSIALAAVVAALAAVAGPAQAVVQEDPKCGNKLCLQTTHEPDTGFVIPDRYLIYRVDVSNPFTATATKVTLTLTLDQRLRLISSPTGCTQPPADPADQPPPPLITCALGSVKPTAPGQPVTRRFLVQVPPDETLVDPITKEYLNPLVSTASISYDARQSDKKTNPDDPDPTDEDFADHPEKVAVDVVQGQSASAIPPAESITLDTDPNGTGATENDKRTAKFVLFAADFFTSGAVEDSVVDDLNKDGVDDFVCPTGLKCPGGGWTQAVIPGPEGLLSPFVGKSHMNLHIVYDEKTIPSGLNTGNYVLIHDKDYVPGETLANPYELISRSCKKNPPPCLEKVDKLADGDLVVDAQVDGNWRYR